jgi:membrane dipeptidase
MKIGRSRFRVGVATAGSARCCRSSLRSLFLLTLFTPTFAMAQTPDKILEHAHQIIKAAPIIDGHNDLPWAIRTSKTAPFDVDAYDLRQTTTGHTDLARLAAGGVGGQFWSIYVPGEVKDSGYAKIQLEEFDIARRFIAKYPDRLTLALTAADIEAANKVGKIASLLGMEGGHAIENSLGALRVYYDLGARYMTLTHNVTLDWADAALDKPVHGGLTAFGREVIAEMNRMGMMVDLSHVSPGVMSDALDVTQSPVIFSHSSARALVDFPRNVPDSILARMPKNGGVVMVTFVPAFVSTEVLAWEAKAKEWKPVGVPDTDTTAVKAQREAWLKDNPRPHATLGQVADHIEHVKTLAGADHVGIGSDFDGIDTTPVGLQDVSAFPALFAELIRRGWSDEDLKKLARGNILRVLRANEQVAARLQKTKRPSVQTIQQLDGASAQLTP